MTAHRITLVVMAGLDPAIHEPEAALHFGSPALGEKRALRRHVDGRVKPGHDALRWLTRAKIAS